jgi:hypothetical protein
MKKKTKKSSKKRTASKSRVSVKAKVSAKSATKSAKKKTASRPKPAPRTRVRESQDVMGNSDIRKVPMSAVRPKARSARADGGAGDYRGISVVEGADSESPRELLEEGQTFESGIVSGVQNARNADEGEVRTHEVPTDDVPTEYDDQDRPG